MRKRCELSEPKIHSHFRAENVWFPKSPKLGIALPPLLRAVAAGLPKCTSAFSRPPFACAHRREKVLIILKESHKEVT